jgi:hypothetical protein
MIFIHAVQHISDLKERGPVTENLNKVTMTALRELNQFLMANGIMNITQNKRITHTRRYLRHYNPRNHEYCIVLIIQAKYWIIELWVKVRDILTIMLHCASTGSFHANVLTCTFTCIGIFASFVLWLHAVMTSNAKSRYACKSIFSKNSPI